MERLDSHVMLLVLLSALVTAPRCASAQIVRWIDSDGEVHYSQGMDSVPLHDRRNAVIVAPDRPLPAAEPTEAPAPQVPPGTGRVTFTPGRPIIVATSINDAGSAQLVLDTKSPRTVIKPRVLLRLGVSFIGSQLVNLSGIAGDAEVLTVNIEKLDVGGARYGPFMVVSDNRRREPELAEGVLGRDFLDHFNVSIDTEAGTLTLTPK